MSTQDGSHTHASLDSMDSTLPPPYPGTVLTSDLAPRLSNADNSQCKSTSLSGPPGGLWVNAETTSLHQAVLAADIQLVRENLDGGASANLVDGSSMTALHLACSQSSPPDPDLLDLLFQRGARLNALDKDDWTPLVHAAQQGHTQAVMKLLEHGADVTISTKAGSTALHLANDTRITESLLLAGAGVACVDKFLRTPLLVACNRGNILVVQMLLRSGAEATVKDAHMAGTLTYCVLGGDSPDLIRLLPLNGAKPNDLDTYGYSSLHHAAAYDRPETTRILIQSGADVAIAASWRGSPLNVQSHMYELLTRQGGRVDYGGGMTPLHVAAYAGSISSLLILLEEGQAPVDQRSSRHLTALHYCGKGTLPADRVEIAQALSKYGADLNAVADGKVRPLHCAAESGMQNLVEYLIEHGAEIGVTTTNGLTPAKLARGNGFEELSSRLAMREPNTRSQSTLRKLKDTLFK